MTQDFNLKLAEELLFDRAQREGFSKKLIDNYRDSSKRKPSPADAQYLFRVLSKRVERHLAERGADIPEPTVLVEDGGHIPWYEDWAKSSTQIQWERYSDFLGADLESRLGAKRSGEIIADIDKASNGVLRRLENPNGPKFATKGLVLGYVQSGKTSNFTGVAAKAADAGYRLIIILTGVHENLRRQTQQRLDCQLTGEPDDTTLPHVSPPKLEEHQWMRLTDAHNDFDTHHKSKLAAMGRYRRPILAIMKKNCRVMKKLLKWISETPSDALSEIPLLLIDDEADQASIDTNYKARTQLQKDIDPTATNQCIRKILRHFPRSAYIGYTATPFANFLVSAGTNSKEWGKDLYPRNFIVALNKPRGYVGADEMFTGKNRDLSFREVPPAERDLLVSSSRKEAGIHPKRITPALEKAIFSFILAGAARISRGDRSKPSTMLIHTSNLTESQSLMKRRIDKFLGSLKSGFDDSHIRGKLTASLGRIWSEDFLPVTRKFNGAKPIPYSAISRSIRDFLRDLQVCELNIASEDSLDYSQNPSLKVLAIGGNKLSRGLTLDGLVTSFYLRPSKQYDTLLQMGRWFGYRQGYEDLTRVYTTKDLADRFEDLALVEREIRDQIKTYEDEKLTPLNFAVRIRVNSAMKVTAANKLGAAKMVGSSYSGRWTQTIWFPLKEPHLLRSNLVAGDKLLSSIKGLAPDKGKRGFIARRVEVGKVLAFLENYHFAGGLAGQVSGIDKGLLLEYIRRVNESGALRSWNVAIASQKNAKDSLGRDVPYGGLKINPVSRGRRDVELLRLGVLSTPDHLYIDHPTRVSAPKAGGKAGETPEFISWRGPNEPLLLLYYISKHSKGRSANTPTAPGSVDLFHAIAKKEDVLGLALVFPKFGKDPLGYLAQELDDA